MSSGANLELFLPWTISFARQQFYDRKNRALQNIYTNLGI